MGAGSVAYRRNWHPQRGWRPSLVGRACLLLGTLLPATALTACADHPPTLTVFAASSLAEVVGDLVASFELARPDVSVTVSLAGSQRLAAQIRDGAPADVFLSADRQQIEAVSGELVGDPVAFATNQLAIAVAPGNPRGIGGLADLDRPDLLVVLPAPEVPAGRYARRALAQTGVGVDPVDLAPNVRAALSKVALGEADAAIVYASDVAARDEGVDAVAIDPGVEAEYFAVVLERAESPELARVFLAHLGTDAGRAILAEHGFGRP